MTEPAPPREPRTARLSKWMIAVLAIGCAAYAGGYVSLRATGRLVRLGGNSASRTEIAARTHAQLASLTGVELIYIDSPLWRLFRPCIAVAEWWRNR